VGTGIGVEELCIGGEEFKLFFLAVVVVPTHYLLVFLWAREGLIFLCFVLFLEICYVDFGTFWFVHTHTGEVCITEPLGW